MILFENIASFTTGFPALLRVDKICVQKTIATNGFISLPLKTQVSSNNAKPSELPLFEIRGLQTLLQIHVSSSCSFVAFTYEMTFDRCLHFKQSQHLYYSRFGGLACVCNSIRHTFIQTNIDTDRLHPENMR